MNHYSLLRCLGGGNTCLEGQAAKTKAEAVQQFQTRWPLLLLDDNGYAKIDDVTYVVAEEFDPLQSNLV